MLSSASKSDHLQKKTNVKSGKHQDSLEAADDDCILTGALGYGTLCIIHASHFELIPKGLF